MGVRWSRLPERIKLSTVTDALLAAMERAEQMEHVLILWCPKGEVSAAGGFMTDGEQTVAETVWMIERFKQWLLSTHGEED
jgi:hypothetical protein